MFLYFYLMNVILKWIYGSYTFPCQAFSWNNFLKQLNRTLYCASYIGYKNIVNFMWDLVAPVSRNIMEMTMAYIERHICYLSKSNVMFTSILKSRNWHYEEIWDFTQFKFQLNFKIQRKMFEQEQKYLTLFSSK